MHFSLTRLGFLDRMCGPDAFYWSSAPVRGFLARFRIDAVRTIALLAFFAVAAIEPSADPTDSATEIKAVSVVLLFGINPSRGERLLNGGVAPPSLAFIVRSQPVLSDTALSADRRFFLPILRLHSANRQRLNPWERTDHWGLDERIDVEGDVLIVGSCGFLRSQKLLNDESNWRRYGGTKYHHQHRAKHGGVA